MSAVNRNQRLAWIATELTKGQSNASIVMGCMTHFPGVSEAVARRDLKEILQRLTEIELENLPEIKTKFLEIGWQLLNECRKYSQMAAAVNQFKTMAIMAGVMDEFKATDNHNTQGVPENKVIRERIAELMKNKKVKQDAQDAGIDLEAMTDASNNK